LSSLLLSAAAPFGAGTSVAIHNNTPGCLADYTGQLALSALREKSEIEKRKAQKANNQQRSQKPKPSFEFWISRAVSVQGNHTPPTAR
jgi:hypothetical protein